MTAQAVLSEVLDLDGHVIEVTLTVAAKGLYKAHCYPCGNTFVSGFTLPFVLHRAAYHAKQCACAPAISEGFTQPAAA